MYTELAEGVGYYLQVSATGLMAAGAGTPPGPSRSLQFRSAVDEEVPAATLRSVLDGVRSAGLEVGGEQLKSRPRGFPRIIRTSTCCGTKPCSRRRPGSRRPGWAATSCSRGCGRRGRRCSRCASGWRRRWTVGRQHERAHARHRLRWFRHQGALLDEAGSWRPIASVTRSHTRCRRRTSSDCSTGWRGLPAPSTAPPSACRA